MSTDSGRKTVSEILSEYLAGLEPSDLPDTVLHTATRDLVDAMGLCIAARETVYMRQVLDSFDLEGSCTAIGHPLPVGAFDAALANGIAVHGEDFDDTLEGAPIRVGAMVIPAVLSASERFGISGKRALIGIVAGLESVCRLNHVAAGHIHPAGFHPVGVIGALGAAAGVATALEMDSSQTAAAFGIAASFSSGIIEYLTDGTWTKRLHPGWAAQSGLRAALLARTGFVAPRTVFDGANNFFRAFAPTATPDHSHLTERLGEDWYMTRIVFKPYACGTMIHPYIDCCRRLRNDVPDPGDIVSIKCDTGEGLVNRLWEPLETKRRPPSGYAAKFSMPFCMALGYFEDDAGLSQFDDAKVDLPHLLEFAAKISYRIDPDNEYPVNYSGHVRATLNSGKVLRYDQPHMRGGMHEPLTDEEIARKFQANAGHGSCPDELASQILEFCHDLVNQPDLSGLSICRF